MTESILLTPFDTLQNQKGVLRPAWDSDSDSVSDRGVCVCMSDRHSSDSNSDRMTE